jgi:transposase
MMGIGWRLPDYSTLSRRMGRLNVDFCHRFLSKTGAGDGVVLLIDSSGFKVFGEGEWKVRKHGFGYRRTWRETHLGVDFNSRDIIGLVNTKSGTHDNTQLKPLVEQVQVKHRIEAIIGDGAYDAKENYLLARRLGIEFIAPPPKNATEHINMYRYHIYDKPGWEERNAVVRHVEEFGLDGWMADVEYHRRSLVENTFYRLKTIFGGNLKSRRETTQYTEQCIRASLIKFRYISKIVEVFSLFSLC